MCGVLVDILVLVGWSFEDCVERLGSFEMKGSQGLVVGVLGGLYTLRNKRTCTSITLIP